ncbi:acyl-CoA/acyl-ACP dehydrogenase [Nocardia farcinica]|uniref:acyl-CoA dehydrogenase family protein n=1 Tax=Nocardia farcinica TaxID=37329 RepID=UPI0018952F26|nr:acyl-CoA dehydrogenase family protein [Nocardia farcinica]MBF6257647.1 acyl-CoA/acyl-ACP dehydrogenase [Nocardia farcinica]MBF6576470.1 acyl-CoA/acyl-ACP dehydrogenase [Nocardia farcinica]
MTHAEMTAPPFEPTAEHRTLREQARQVAAEFAPRAVAVRRHTLEHGEMHPELWRAFRANGLAGAALSPEVGGRGAGVLGAALVLEAFAEHGIVLWMPALTTAIACAMERLGPAPARDAWLPRIAAGTAQLAMAATEPESGHNLFRVRTEIRVDSDGFVVSGRKRVSSGVDLAERVLVFGRATEGFTTVLVDPRAPGVTVTEVPMGFREGVRQFELDFHEVAVPAADVVGRAGAGLLTLWPFTHVERVLTAAICTGSARHSIERAVRHAKTRTVVGSAPIGANQALAHPLARLHARTAAVQLLVHRCAARIDADHPDSAAEAAAAKLLAADLAFDAADHTTQVLGAEAWDERSGWIDLYLDARLARSGPVSNEFALNHLAEHVLGLPLHR